MNPILERESRSTKFLTRLTLMFPISHQHSQCRPKLLYHTVAQVQQQIFKYQCQNRGEDPKDVGSVVGLTSNQPEQCTVCYGCDGYLDTFGGAWVAARCSLRRRADAGSRGSLRGELSKPMASFHPRLVWSSLPLYPHQANCAIYVGPGVVDTIPRIKSPFLHQSWKLTERFGRLDYISFSGKAPCALPRFLERGCYSGRCL